jgi:hypothetical protein
MISLQGKTSGKRREPGGVTHGRKSLIEDGLRIESSFGNATLTVKAVMSAQVEPN